MNREEDRKLINSIPRDKLPDFIFMHLRNMWSVDGLYFIGIEERWGTEGAIEVDRFVWEVMGKIEARRIKQLFDINGRDVSAVIEALRYSGWAMDIEDKEIILENKNRAIVRNLKCRVQLTRIKKGLGEFPCKQVRWGFLKAFAKEFNPDIKVLCNVCPPDKHPDDLWCEWEFILEE